MRGRRRRRAAPRACSVRCGRTLKRPRRAASVPANQPLTGMRHWGVRATFCSLQRHGMPAEPEPAAAQRRGAAPAHAVYSGSEPDPWGASRCRLRPRGPTPQAESGRAPVRTRSAPRGRYYCVPTPQPSTQVLWCPPGPDRTARPRPAWPWLLRAGLGPGSALGAPVQECWWPPVRHDPLGPSRPRCRSPRWSALTGRVLWVFGFFFNDRLTLI